VDLALERGLDDIKVALSTNPLDLPSVQVCTRAARARSRSACR
jgi:hypothetical protein